MTERRAYRGRKPSAPMGAATLRQVVEQLEENGVEVWLDGGWGVDALLGRETREHDDLDLVAELRHSVRIVELLTGLSPEVQVMVHAGYELGEKDFLELYLLRERFGVGLPDEVLEGVAGVAEGFA